MIYSRVELGSGASQLSKGEIRSDLESMVSLPTPRKVLIISDDAFRPNTLLHREVVEYVLWKVGTGNVSIVIASGMHRASTQEEITSKLGSTRRLILYRHSPLMRFPLEQFNDHTIISIGTIMPHIFVRRSGGGKCIVPGLSSFAGAIDFHSSSKDDAQDIIRRSDRKIDYTINGVINRTGDVVNVVINNVPKHHDIHRTVKYNFGVILEEKADIVILEPLFKIGDFMQAMNVLRLCKYNIVKDDGMICIKCDPTDGMGVHYLFQQMNGFSAVKFDDSFSELVGDREICIMCPEISRDTIQDSFTRRVKTYNSLTHLVIKEGWGINISQKVVHYVGADVMLPLEE